MKKITAILLSAVFLFIFQQAYAGENNIEAAFALIQNNNDTFDATVTVKNNTHEPIANWQLAFTFNRPILTIAEGTIVSQSGDFHIIAPTASPTLAADSSIVFHITGQTPIKHETDAFMGFFIITTDPISHQTKTLSVETLSPSLPAWHPEQGKDEYTMNSKRNQTSIEGNPIQPAASAENSLIVPLPTKLERHPGEFTLSAQTALYVASPQASEAVQFFSQSIATATGYHLQQRALTQTTPENAIIFLPDNNQHALGNEGYVLQVLPKHIIIRANTSAGYFYAVQSLRQLFPAKIFSHQFIKQTWSAPCVSIEDSPRFSYRGLHLDVARHFVPKDQILRLLDLMALHKLNNFHWHLSDDEGWRIEIKRYPTLTSIGGFRGYNLPIQPSLGSSAERYGGYYTQDDIREVVAYAKERHITIIPEFDMPGHARAMIVSLPNELKDPTDQSTYTSVQGYHDNVLTPCIDSTFEVIDNIMTEVAQLFPGDTIHVGSDEVPQGAWMNSANCQAKFAGKSAAEIKHEFMARVQTIVQSKNKKMAGWEEILEGGELDRSTLIYSWTGEDAGYNAAQQGYPVIMAPAQYLYFDLAYNDDPKEPGYYWAGFVDTFTAYSYAPIKASWPNSIAKQIRGIQGELWSENIDSQDRLDYLAFPKVAALAEIAWTTPTRRNWINFSERLGQFHLPRLDAYGVKYRISLPGINLSAIQRGVLEANIEFPGLTLRYSTDGKEPTAYSPVYMQTLNGSGANVQMSAFDTTNRSSRVANTN